MLGLLKTIFSFRSCTNGKVYKIDRAYKLSFYKSLESVWRDWLDRIIYEFNSNFLCIVFKGGPLSKKDLGRLEGYVNGLREKSQCKCKYRIL